MSFEDIFCIPAIPFGPGCHIPYGLDEPACCSQPSAMDTLLAGRASEPKQVTVDGVSVQQHSLAELIALDKHLTAKAKASRGIRFQKLIPPGAV